jgi:hypothetical protein
MRKFGGDFFTPFEGVHYLVINVKPEPISCVSTKMTNENIITFNYTNAFSHCTLLRAMWTISKATSVQVYFASFWYLI